MEEDIPGIPALLEYLRKEGIHSCILYGSAATGSLRPHSDIDLAIAGDREFSTETLARLYLETSMILGREVDLRDLRRARGLFLKEILTKGKILLNDDPTFLGSKAIEMMDYQTDLAPHINRIREQQIESMLYEK